MGVSYNIYIGPFFRCRNPTVQREESYRGCPRCENELRTDFCPLCGSASTDLTKKTEGQAVPYRDRIEAFYNAGLNEDTLVGAYCNDASKANEDWFVKNHRDAPGRHIDPRNDFGLLVSEHIDAENEKARFKGFYEKAFNVLVSLYGDGNVSVGWGVISYTN